MATTTRGNQAQYVEFDEYVDSKIVRAREAIRTTDISLVVVTGAAVVLGYLVLFVIADHWLGMDFLPPLIRSVIGLSILGGTFAWAIYKIGLPHRRRINRLFVAREIETHEESLEGNLLNLVDLQRSDRTIDKPVMRSIEKRAAVGLSMTDLDETVDRQPLMRSAYTLLGLVIAACVYTLLTVSLGLKPIGPSLLRAFGAAGTAPTRINFESVEIQVATDAAFVAADTSPRVPARFQPQVKVTLNKAIEPGEHVTLFFTTDDQRFVDQPLEMRPVEGSLQQVFPEFSATLLGENDQGLLQDLSFRIEAGDASTPDYTIHVSTAPSASVQSVHYKYPDYMRLTEETRDGGNIDGWDGTTVTINATASQPVRSARLVFSDSEDTTQRAEEYPMHVADGTALTVQWTLSFREDDTDNYPRFYRIICQDEQGATDLHPTLYSIAIRPDLPPLVEILQPRSDLERPSNAVVPLLIKASDPDFQLKHLTLRVELEGKQLVEHNRELFAGEQPSFGPTSVDFPLQPLGLQPGQVVSYWIEARDNKMPLGNRTNTAPKLSIRITEPVTPEEAQKQHKKEQKQQEEQAEREKEMNGSDSDSQEPGDTGPPEGKKNSPPTDDSNEKPDNEPNKTDPSDSGTKGDTKTESPKPNEPTPDDPKPGKNDDKSSKDGSSDKPSDPNSPDSTDQKPKAASEKNPQTSKGAQSDEKPSESEKDSSNKKTAGNGEPDPDAEPLKTDGSDDDEALKRLRDFQNQKDSRPAPGDSQTPKTNEPNADTAKPDPENKTASDSKNDKSKSKTGNESTRPGNKDQKATDASGDKKNPKGQTDPKSPSRKNPDISKPSKNTTTPSDPEKSKTAQPKTSNPKSSGTDTSKPGPDSKNKNNEGDGSGNPQNKKPSSDDNAKKPNDPKNQKAGTKSQPGDESNNKSSSKKTNGKDSGQGKSQKPTDPNSAKGKQSGKKGKNSGKAKSGTKKGTSNPSSKSGGKPKSNPSEKSGSKGGKGDSGNKISEGSGGTGKSSGDQKQGDEPGDISAKKPTEDKRPPGGEEANREFSKEAANLVLKRLEEEIKRGSVDPELLKELGWSKNEVRQFADRLRKHVDTPIDDTSPGAEAQRRQFEELLKNVTIKSNGTKRTGQTQRLRTTDSINSQDVPVPLQFREAVKLYRRNLIRGRTKDTTSKRK